MARTLPKAVSAALVALPLALATPARAQEVPAGTGTGITQATKGSTDLVSEKFQAVDRDSGKESKDAAELSLSAGALSSSGNSRTQAITSAAKFRLRREANQLKLAAAANYARAALPGTDPSTTVQNFQGVERYDRFLGDLALFVAAQERNDKFQGLDLRFQLDPGVGYYFLNEKARLLWTELGYDYLFDLRRDDARALPGGGLLDKTRTLHSGRAFVGYEQAIGDSSKLTTGVEFLQGLSDTGVQRLNVDLALTAKIVGALSMSLTVSDRYESKPLPGKEKNDLVTAASLVYTVL